MTIDRLPSALRAMDAFHHIDMGFLNRRLCLTALPAEVREAFHQKAKTETDHFSQLSNDHLLVTMLLDVYQQLGSPTLLEALSRAQPSIVFRSTEQLSACPGVYDAERVQHDVKVDIDFGKPVTIAYHTEHIVSSTGRMTLSEGYEKGYVQSIVGILHNRGDSFEIEPIVMGAPWFDHPRNGAASSTLMWHGRDFGELLPEDIEQFSRMKEVRVGDAAEWMNVMSTLPERRIKEAFAHLLSEPTKKDWGGEANDHFSSNVGVDGRRFTAAFLLKGPAQFREMTLDMCGARADQIFRLVQSEADLSIVQHAHLVGTVVRETLRRMVVQPGGRRKYCVIDGQATYRILKAYNLLAPDAP
jgi:hypothetical protein